MSVQSFLSPEEFFAGLLDTMPPETAKLHSKMKHIRIEPAYRNRKFFIYKMDGNKPKKLGTVSVHDFVCDDVDGTSMQLCLNDDTSNLLLVGYTPVQLFDFPVFLHMPVVNKLRWSSKRDDNTGPSLNFLIAVRTRSRFHLREQGVVYLETSRTFDKEFNPLPAL